MLLIHVFEKTTKKKEEVAQWISKISGDQDSAFKSCTEEEFSAAYTCTYSSSMLYVYTYVQIPIVRPCIGFLRGGPISEGPQKTELIFAAYSIRHDDAAFPGQVPAPLVLGCYPYSIFLRIAC